MICGIMKLKCDAEGCESASKEFKFDSRFTPMDLNKSDFREHAKGWTHNAGFDYCPEHAHLADRPESCRVCQFKMDVVANPHDAGSAFCFARRRRVAIPDADIDRVQDFCPFWAS